MQRRSEIRTCALPEPHTILKRVFNTPSKVKELALACSVTTNHVHKWLRGGESSAPSDLDRLCSTIFLASTFGEDGLRGAGLIADYVREYYLSIVEQSASPFADANERAAEAMSILAEAKDAIEALTLNKPTQDAIRELVELRDIAERAIDRLSVSEEVTK